MGFKRIAGETSYWSTTVKCTARLVKPKFWFIPVRKGVDEDPVSVCTIKIGRRLQNVVLKVL